MRNAEVTNVIAFLNASWANKPIDESTAAIWGLELAPYDFDRVIVVLRSLLRTQEWRPSLAQILKPLDASAGRKTAIEAFADVWEQIPKRPPHVTDIEQRAIDLLGGWAVLRGWEIHDRHWHAKRFAAAYEDAVDRASYDAAAPALPPADRPALKAGDR